MVAEDLHGGLGVGVEGRLELELRDADALEERLHRHTKGEGSQTPRGQKIIHIHKGGESDSTWPMIYNDNK